MTNVVCFIAENKLFVVTG